ncbi:MAG: deoxyribose-phosphate aldolase [Bacteroidales bacterium]
MVTTDYYQAEYGAGEDDVQTALQVGKILGDSPSGEPHRDLLKMLFGLLDLTSLNTDDNDETARRLSRLLNEFPSHFPGVPQVAAVCVYPTLVEEIRRTLTTSAVRLASVGTGFPSSQTFLSVKLAECELLMKKGADEIDVVIPVGRLVAGQTGQVMNELLLVREITKNATLKVILETGLLKSARAIRLASLIAMEAGADFIKTSTGKTAVSATPEAAYTMARAIRDFQRRSGRKVGIKAAGGIAEIRDALVYHALVNAILGDEWMNPGLFRIGASRLANNLLTGIAGHAVSYF